MTITTPHDKQGLLVQYQQCIENYRMWDKHIWQLPSVTILIGSAVIGVAFGPLYGKIWPSSFVLTLGMILSFSMYIAVKKYRFFQYHTIEMMKKIEDELLILPYPIITGKGNMMPKNWVEGQRAGEWLAYSEMGVFVLLSLLLVYNIISHFLC